MSARIDAIALDAADTVATALRPLAAGTTATVQTPDGTRAVALRETIPLCHKLALSEHAAGARVVKYGAVIGEATAAIAAGALVHVHNMASLRARRS